MKIIKSHLASSTREERELLHYFRSMDQRRQMETLDLARDDAAFHPVKEHPARKLRLVATSSEIQIGGAV